MIFFMDDSGAVTAVTWNPSDKSADISLSGGNLIAGRTGTPSVYRSVRATQARSTTKRYFEVAVNAVSPASMMVGLATSAASLTNYVGSSSTSWGYNASNGGKYTNGALTAFGAAWAASDVIGIAYDAVTGRIWFAKNNTWQGSGNPAAGTSPAFTATAGSVLFPMGSIYNVSGQTFTGKFKAADLTYSPPAGFSPWE